MSSDRPAIQLFYRDWEADEALACVTLEAEGLWLRMCMVMHRSPRIGYLLKANGQPIRSAAELAAVIRRPIEEVARSLTLLETEAVFSRDDDGIIYSRRMVRQSEVSERNRQNIQQRWNKDGKDTGCEESRNTNGNTTRNTKMDTTIEDRTDTTSGIGIGIGIGKGSGFGSDLKEEGMQGEKQPALALAPTEQTSTERSDVDQVIEHYRTYHPKFRGGEKEKQLIRARLKEHYTVEDLCRAIDGNHMLQFNVEHKQHALELIVRNASKVVRFIDAAQDGPQLAINDKERTTALAGEQWLLMHERGTHGR